MGIFRNYWDMFLLREEGYKRATQIGFGTAILIHVLLFLSYLIGVVFLQLLLQTFGVSTENWFIFLLEILFTGIFWIPWYLFFVFAFWLGAKTLGGKGSYKGHFVGASNIMIYGLLLVIPVLGWVLSFFIGLWAIIMGVKLAQHHHKLEVGSAIGSGLLGTLYLFLAFFIIWLLFFVLVLSLLMGASFGA